MLKLNSTQSDFVRDDFFKDAEDALIMTVGARVSAVLEADKVYTPLWAEFKLDVCLANAEELLNDYAGYDCFNCLSRELTNMVINMELKAYFAKAFNHLQDMIEASYGESTCA